MDFDATGQLLITYSAFIIHKKNENIAKQCISSLFYDSVRREVSYNNLTEFGIPMKIIRLKKCV